MFSIGSVLPEKESEIFMQFARTFHGCLRQAPHHSSQEKAISLVKQITITIETNSLLVVRGRNVGRRWCPQCAAESDAVALGSAEAQASLQSPGLEEWLISGAVHRFETGEGSELICLNSLRACARNLRFG